MNEAQTRLNKIDPKHTNPLTAPCEHIAKNFVAKNFA